MRAAADDHVPAGLGGFEHPQEMVGFVREVGIGEGDRRTARREDTGAYGRTLAPVGRQHQYAIGTRAARLLGCVVERAVVDHHDLDRAHLSLDHLADPADR